MKNHPQDIWFLTAIAADEETMIRHPKGEIKIKHTTHTFGYHYGLKQALHALRENHGDMYECLYNYLVIEQIDDGIQSLVNAYIWFKWKEGIGWTKCDRPVWARGITNWAIG